MKGYGIVFRSRHYFYLAGSNKGHGNPQPAGPNANHVIGIPSRSAHTYWNMRGYAYLWIHETNAMHGCVRPCKARAHAPQAPFQRRLPRVFNRFNLLDAEALIQVGRNHHSVVRGDAEQREKTDPDRNAEVDRVNAYKF